MKAIGSSIAVSIVLTCGSRSSAALSPEAASKAYDTYASNYDELDGGGAASILGLDEARSELFQQAQGKVLEIGAGTGLNLSKYHTASVSSLTLVDISQGMLQEAKSRATALKLPFPIDFIKADATSQLVDLFGENTFDTVVDSFSLCVMGNEGAKSCLEQLTTVAKAESGRILLLENSRSSNPVLAKYQDITAETAASAGGKGCVYNQDVRALIINTRGLTIEKEASYVTGLFRSFICVKHVTQVPNR
jgi:ubiquinone/menaquinone biosynthesis C-methylase UbiE